MTAVRILLLSLFYFSTPSGADELSICYNYNCVKQAQVVLALPHLKALKTLLRQASDAESERHSLANVLGLLRIFAGEQTPIFRDRGKNQYDEEMEGRMDCIDHATNNMAYLRLLEHRGWLRYHRVLPPVMRAPWLVNAHWGALIEDRASGMRYVVDSWFSDHGYPADIFELQAWLAGKEPGP